jgi:hypothetical protein
MLTVAVCMLVLTCQVRAQNRGVYPLGMSATNSGVTPQPGFTYVNQLLIYSRDKSKGPNGEVLATGNNSVVMDMNTLAWVSKKKILGGAKFSTISLQYDPTFHLNSSETEILLRMTVPIVRRHAGIHDPQTAIRKVITLTAFTTVRGADFSFRGVRPCAASQASMRKPRTTLGEKEERRG